MGNLNKNELDFLVDELTKSINRDVINEIIHRCFIHNKFILRGDKCPECVKIDRNKKIDEIV